MKILITKKKKNTWLMITSVILLGLGLVARDTWGINIHKFLFLAIAAIPIFLLKMNHFLVFSSLLIPLYVGLPGNYISLFLFIRLVYELFRKRIRCNASGFLISVLMTGYLFIQNMFYQDMSVFHIMGALDFVLLFMLISAILQYNETENAIIAYLVGVVLTGMIMLITTLQYYTLADLMKSSTRLGDTDLLQYSRGANMVISVDPNFYGMNVMAAVSSGMQIVFNPNRNGRNRAYIISLCVIAVALALTGLSRAFFLVLAVWGIMSLFSQGKIARGVKVCLSLTVLVVLFAVMFPEIVEGLWTRFSESDMSGANGRWDLIVKYYEEWEQGIWRILFGIGLYNCFTHCTPLQYLFGIGLLGAGILLCWFLRIIAMTGVFRKKVGIRAWIPFVTTFVLYSAIPAAGAVNYTYPILVPILALTVFETGRERMT